MTLRGTNSIMDGLYVYTMEVTIKDEPCHACMMLRRRGSNDDATATPYFFSKGKTRDDAIAYITKVSKSSKSTGGRWIAKNEHEVDYPIQ